MSRKIRRILVYVWVISSFAIFGIGVEHWLDLTFGWLFEYELPLGLANNGLFVVVSAPVVLVYILGVVFGPTVGVAVGAFLLYDFLKEEWEWFKFKRSQEEVNVHKD